MVNDANGQPVDLLLDGAVLVRLEKPFTYVWDTTAFAEGGYSLTARVGDVESESRTIVVDRTPPSALSQSPKPGDQNVYLCDPIRGARSGGSRRADQGAVPSRHPQCGLVFLVAELENDAVVFEFDGTDWVQLASLPTVGTPSCLRFPIPSS